MNNYADPEREGIGVLEGKLVIPGNPKPSTQTMPKELSSLPKSLKS